MILKLVVGAIVCYLMFKLFRKGFPQTGGRVGSAKTRTAVGEDLVEDPVCHAYVPIGHACRAEIDGKSLYFCSSKCLEQYQNESKR